jgi:hypothetical protein
MFIYQEAQPAAAALTQSQTFKFARRSRKKSIKKYKSSQTKNSSFGFFSHSTCEKLFQLLKKSPKNRRMGLKRGWGEKFNKGEEKCKKVAQESLDYFLTFPFNSKLTHAMDSSLCITVCLYGIGRG